MSSTVLMNSRQVVRSYGRVRVKVAIVDNLCGPTIALYYVERLCIEYSCNDWTYQEGD